MYVYIYIYVYTHTHIYTHMIHSITLKHRIQYNNTMYSTT